MRHHYSLHRRPLYLCPPRTPNLAWLQDFEGLWGWGVQVLSGTRIYAHSLANSIRVEKPLVRCNHENVNSKGFNVLRSSIEMVADAVFAFVLKLALFD